MCISHSDGRVIPLSYSLLFIFGYIFFAMLFAGKLSADYVQIISEDFEDGWAAAASRGWSIVDAGDNPGEQAAQTWTDADPGELGAVDGCSGTFMIVDSDVYGECEMDEQLISPAFDCSGRSEVLLVFHHYFWYYPEGLLEVADLDVSINGGDWQNIVRYQQTDYGLKEIDISSAAAGQQNVRVRWHYYNASYEWLWQIDNVKILASFHKGDFNGDGYIDYNDLFEFAACWHASLGEPTYDACADFNDDEYIDYEDLFSFVAMWHTHL